MRHHTKDKGDLGVAYAKADLIEKGYQLLLPLTEHAPFDLVGYKDECFVRVQVKYRAAKNGVVTLAFKSWWADRHGVHMRRMNKDEVDVVCIYCPDTRRCYYVDPKQHGSHISLRIAPALNGNSANVNWAEHFTDMPSSVRGSAVGGVLRRLSLRSGDERP